MPYNVFMNIEFDRTKDAANHAKHGVSLSFGAEVLADTNRLDVLDTRFDYGEDRFVSYGEVSGRVWVCVYAPRLDSLRIISVRKANARETERYHTAAR